jgi:hypothetical protein
MGSAIKQGDPIPLQMTLFDGNTTRVVKAFLRDDSGNAIATVTLTHRLLGLYESSAQLMPRVEWVSALFVIYQPNGTDEDTTYGRADDQFYRLKDLTDSDALGVIMEENVVDGTVDDATELLGIVED